MFGPIESSEFLELLHNIEVCGGITQHFRSIFFLTKYKIRCKFSPLSIHRKSIKNRVLNEFEKFGATTAIFNKSVEG